MKIQVECKFCNLSFLREKCEIDRSKRTGSNIFCSKSCSAKYNNNCENPKVLGKRRKKQGKCHTCSKRIRSCNKYCSDCRPKYRRDIIHLKDAIYLKHHKCAAF